MNTYSYLSLFVLIPSFLSAATQVQQEPVKFVFNLSAQKTPNSHPVYEVDGERVINSFINKKITLLHMDRHFFVREGNNVTPVLSCCVDKELRSKSIDQVSHLLQESTITITQRDNGQYILSCRPQLMGGGLLGAKFGFYLGKGAVHLVGHGLIGLVSLGAGAAATMGGGPMAGAWATATAFKTLEGMFAIPIEAASNVVGLGTGIAGGVATGPA